MDSEIPFQNLQNQCHYHLNVHPHLCHFYQLILFSFFLFIIIDITKKCSSFPSTALLMLYLRKYLITVCHSLTKMSWSSLAHLCDVGSFRAPMSVSWWTLASIIHLFHSSLMYTLNGLFKETSRIFMILVLLG